MNIKHFERVFENRKPVPQGPHRHYSVMVPLVDKDDELYLLFEVRSEALDIQPGEVCFPGGRREEGESLLECAIRETCEELTIEETQLRVIAQLDYIHTYSHFTLYPFLCAIDYAVYQALQVNLDEVKEVFLVPLSYLLETEPLTYTFDVSPNITDDFPYELINSKGGYNWRKGKNFVPIYKYDGHAIWGLTGRIVKHLIDVMKQEV